MDAVDDLIYADQKQIVLGPLQDGEIVAAAELDKRRWCLLAAEPLD